MAKRKLQPQRALVVSVPTASGPIHYVNIGGVWCHNGSLRAAQRSYYWGKEQAYFDKDGFWNDESLGPILTKRMSRFRNLKEMAEIHGVSLRKLRPYIRRWEA